MFLLDANIFIEAKNFYYAFDTFPGFWEWLDQRQQNSEIGSVIPIYEELKQGNDELAEWIKERKDSGWFLPVDDAETQLIFGDIVNWVMGQDFRDEAKVEFLAGADPWLIAKTQVIGATVVTHETFEPNIRRKVKIPNICRKFGVDYIDTFELLRRFRASFGLI